MRLWQVIGGLWGVGGLVGATLYAHLRPTPALGQAAYTISCETYSYPTQSQVGIARPLQRAWRHPAEVFYQLYK